MERTEEHSAYSLSMAPECALSPAACVSHSQALRTAVREQRDVRSRLSPDSLTKAAFPLTWLRPHIFLGASGQRVRSGNSRGACSRRKGSGVLRELGWSVSFGEERFRCSVRGSSGIGALGLWLGEYSVRDAEAGVIPARACVGNCQAAGAAL